MIAPPDFEGELLVHKISVWLGCGVYRTNVVDFELEDNLGCKIWYLTLSLNSDRTGQKRKSE